MDRKNELLAKEAANSLGVSLEWVYRLIRAGRLKARKQYDMWFVPNVAVEKLRGQMKRTHVHKESQINHRSGKSVVVR